MAQLGIFVPAQYCSLKLITNIQTAMPNFISSTTNSSSLFNELALVERIFYSLHNFENVESSSLILIDEICQTTAPNEGIALLFTILEYLANMEVGLWFSKSNHTF